MIELVVYTGLFRRDYVIYACLCLAVYRVCVSHLYISYEFTIWYQIHSFVQTAEELSLGTSPGSSIKIASPAH